MYSLAALRTGDYSKAAKWYGLAAKRGDAHAQSVLGFMYSAGQGLPQNYSEAARWYSLAANQGKYEAQFFLGLAYARGQGVSQSYTIAYMWLSLAAAKAQAFAKDRDAVAALLTTRQLAEAQKLASEWSPKKASTGRRKFRPLSGQVHAASGLPEKVQRKGLAMVSLK